MNPTFSHRWTRRQFLHAIALTAGTVPGIARGEPASAEAIRLDRDGMLRVRGRRDFVLGLYQLPAHSGALHEAAEAGFNLVHRPPTPAAYDEIHRLGLRGWSALGSLPEGNRREAEERMRHTVNALRSHPALLFWETEDEPTFVWKEPGKLRTSAAQINATAAYIRSLDPAHPLYLNHAPTNLVSTLQEYNPASDIVATDIYPVIPRGLRELFALWPDGRQGDLLNDTISQVGPYVDKMRTVAGPRRAVFMVLQAFAWERLREKDRDLSQVLYPTRAQLRFMAWQAIMHGANGLLWWGLAYTPSEAALWNDLKNVVRELAEVRPALAAPAAKLRVRLRYHDTGHSLDRGIEWLAKPWGRDTLLLAVNADGNPVEVTFDGFRGYRHCQLLFAGELGEWEGSKLRARFEPFGTRAWRLSR